MIDTAVRKPEIRRHPDEIFARRRFESETYNFDRLWDRQDWREKWLKM